MTKQQETNTLVEKDLAVIISVYFFTIVGVISLFTILFVGFFTFVMPRFSDTDEMTVQNQKTNNTTVTKSFDQYFVTNK